MGDICEGLDNVVHSTRNAACIKSRLKFELSVKATLPSQMLLRTFFDVYGKRPFVF